MESFTNSGPAPSPVLPSNGKTGYGTAYARELFLFGDGDGKPVRNKHRIMALSGISEKTWERHCSAWKGEAEEIARGAVMTGDGGGRVLIRQVSSEHLATHKAAIESLRIELERVRNCLPYLSAGSDAHRETVKLLASLTKSFAAESGIAGKYSALETMEREMLKRSVSALANDRDEKPVGPANGHTFEIE